MKQLIVYMEMLTAKAKKKELDYFRSFPEGYFEKWYRECYSPRCFGKAKAG